MRDLRVTRKKPRAGKSRRAPMVLSVGLSLCWFVLLCSGCSDESDFADSDSGRSTDSDTNPDRGDETAWPELVDENGCNPVGSVGDCLLPYPSDVFLVEDATMPTGKRVNITGDAVMTTLSMKKMQPMQIYKTDGFSRHAQIGVLFPEGVDDSTLVFHTGDVTASVGDQSPTVILEAATGERVVHFAELDPMAKSDERRTLLIRPMVRLKEKTRYIVVVRDLKNKRGELVSATEGFQKIRNGETTDDTVLALLSKVYEDKIFPVLEAAGINRSESLQLAWDFTTGSEENTTRDMLTVQADSILRFNVAAPEVSVTKVTENLYQTGTKLVQGTIKVPLYVESTEVGAKLNRNADGKVVAIGEADVPWSAVIPPSVLNREAGAKARAIQYGHGSFGSQDEIIDEKMLKASEFLKSVFFAVDWWGFAKPDMAHVVKLMSTNPSELFSIGDRLHQAMVNQIALSYAIQDTMTRLEELRVGGSLAHDPAHVYFYGNSMGGILGATYTSLAPKIERSVIGVGGASLPLIMYRSVTFKSFYTILKMQLKDDVNIQKFPLVYQTVSDRFDPVTYAPHMIRDLYPGSPAARKVLLQIGLGDDHVCSLSGELLARISGLKLLEPSFGPVYGLESVEAPFDGSAMVVFDFNVDPVPAIKAEIPEDVNVVHNGIRLSDEANAQIDAFLSPDGMIEATCDGSCNPD